MTKTVKILLVFGLVVIASLVVYSFFIEPGMLKVQRLVLTADSNAKFVFMSDTHLPSLNEQEVLRLVREEKPDAVLFGGDACNVQGADCEKFFSELSNIAPIYAVLGNNDYFGSRIANATYLNNTKTTILGITLCGVAYYGPEKTGNCDISVVHSYDDIAYANGSSLVLVGHSHGGQVEIPMVTQAVLDAFLCEGCGTHRYGEYSDRGMRVYVTSGVGSFLMRPVNLPLNVRFLRPPEIVVVELHRK